MGETGAATISGTQNLGTDTTTVTGDKPKTLFKTTSHWCTTNQANEVVKEGIPLHRAERPLWTLPRQAYSSRRSNFKTEYHNQLGSYGHNPRATLNENHQVMEAKVDDLTMGSTKVTSHIPGYNGYIPRTDLNPTCLA